MIIGLGKYNIRYIEYLYKKLTDILFIYRPIYIYIYIYICIYICVCVCVCVCGKNEKEYSRVNKLICKRKVSTVQVISS